jgi:chromosome segregation ATPase
MLSLKVKYGLLLQQFKELKDREKKNEARHRELNKELDTYERDNTDLTIKIKMIESELNGSTEKDIEELFRAEIKAKTDKIAQLEAYIIPIFSKKTEQALAAKRKNEQNEAVIAKLKNSLKEKEALLSEKETEYNQTLQATADLTAQLSTDSDDTKRKQELESELAKVEAQLKEENDKIESLKKQLTEPAASGELKTLESKVKELQQAILD